MEKHSDENGRIKIKLSLREWFFVIGAIAAIGSYGATMRNAVAQNKTDIAKTNKEVNDVRDTIKDYFENYIIPMSKSITAIKTKMGIEEEFKRTFR